MKFKFLGQKRLQILAVVGGMLLANFAILAQASATTYMTHASVIEYNMDTSGTSAFAIAFTAGAADSAATMSINFGSWGGTVNTTQTVTTTGCTALTGATNVLPTAGTLSASGSGSIVTISGLNSLTSGQSYCAILSSTSAVTNPSTSAIYPVVLTDGTDTATPAIDTIGNDQIAVTASVQPSFTMSLGTNSDALGSLSSTALTTSGGVTTTISTNAVSGWFLWAEDTNAGLRSTVQSHTISSVSTTGNSTMNAAKLGTEAYALGVTTGNATTNYADAGGITGGGLSTSAYSEIATGAATSSTTVTTKELADISGSTPPAADYADTISLVGAGSF